MPFLCSSFANRSSSCLWTQQRKSCESVSWNVVRQVAEKMTTKKVSRSVSVSLPSLKFPMCHIITHLQRSTRSKPDRLSITTSRRARLPRCVTLGPLSRACADDTPRSQGPEQSKRYTHWPKLSLWNRYSRRDRQFAQTPTPVPLDIYHLHGSNRHGLRSMETRAPNR